MALNKETQELLVECVGYRLESAKIALKDSDMNNIELMRKIVKLDDLCKSLSSKTTE